MARIVRALGVVGCVAACSTSEQLVAPADSTGGEVDTTGGSVQRATLTLTVRTDTADAAVVGALGWAGAVVPRAEVVIQRAGSSATLTDTAEASGVKTFADLLPGSYRVSALRLLAPDEVARLTPGDRDVDAFGAGNAVTVRAPVTAASLTAVAGRRGSLVISEFSFGQRSIPGNVYVWGGYMELYNNADTTVYLDGKIVANGFSYNIDSRFESCAMDQRFRVDPAGIWAYQVAHFPGRGHDYPLAPAAVVVIATDAVDHRGFFPNAQDLSHADFEFIGAADIDNPAVPNMIFLGGYESLRGHGMDFAGSNDVLPVIADTLDYAALPKSHTDYFGTPMIRIPAERILDVALATGDRDPRFGWCAPPFVHPSFDKQDAPIFILDDDMSVHRRLIPRVGGTPILQRTKTSARDLVRGPFTPGTIP